MLTPYLLSFNSLLTQRSEVLDYLDTLPQILNWYAILPESIIIISDYNAKDIREFLSKRYPYTYFIMTEIPRENHDGWLPRIVWDFIMNPHSSGRWR